jgi:hypothetical protein
MLNPKPTGREKWTRSGEDRTRLGSGQNFIYFNLRNKWTDLTYQTVCGQSHLPGLATVHFDVSLIWSQAVRTLEEEDSNNPTFIFLNEAGGCSTDFIKENNNTYLQ